MAGMTPHLRGRIGCITRCAAVAGAVMLGGVASLGMAGCREKAPASGPSGAVRAPGPLRVVATIPPVRGLIEPILSAAGAKHELTLLVAPGTSEHGFELTPSGMEAIARADLVVMVGLEMEPQVEKFIGEHPSASRRVVVLADAVKGSLVEPAEAHGDAAAHEDHDHGHDGHHHHHHGADPHVWLDPVLAGSMVTECTRTLRPLAEIAAVDAARVDEAGAAVRKRVDEVHEAYQRGLAGAPRRTIVVGHDAYGYLAARYGLEVIAITGLSAGEPQPGDLKKAADAVMERKLTTIFVEPQLSPSAAQRVAAATGVKTAVLDPLGNGDWFALMRANLAALKEALGVAEAASGAAAPASTSPAP